MSEVERVWQLLVDEEIASDDEIVLCVKLAGYTEDTLLDVLYIRTGYSTVRQYEEATYE